MAKKPVTAIILGAGHRAMAYADFSLAHPDLLKIVGVADLDEYRRKMVQEKFGFSEEFCFESAEALAKAPKFADAVINGTMDEQHVETSIPLLGKGYDMLLEKPFAVNDEEMERLLEVVKKHNNKVMICHVLRYTPFYSTIKEKLISGAIGEVINIQTVENVSYHHLSTSFVRGKWGNSKKCHTSMLLAKCCHDMDIMMWLMSPNKPVTVSSVGSKLQFKEENAPENSGTRCLVDCPRVDFCRYSAKRLYLDHPDRWEVYVWRDLESIENPTEEDRRKVLIEGDYGRCMYKCDNDVVDHQSVLVNFSNGATGTHNMTGGSAEPLRTIRIIGTKGEIYGEFENKFINVKIINPDPGKDYDEEYIDLSNVSSEGHSGGDERLTSDFVRFIRGEEHSVSCTSIYDSVAGHKVIFLADESMNKNGEQIKVEL
ncbi:MAG: Gfo/Idh/MocA family oxidoreductase [Clostridia bacterium]|nr:Gfo/Idh/MocA family oxidoreductase [Clostridia bacterium]MBO5432853.1 Gfo/Idh/MocA family oxidoreductase [Clostridia bacterium]